MADGRPSVSGKLSIENATEGRREEGRKGSMTLTNNAAPAAAVDKDSKQPDGEQQQRRFPVCHSAPSHPPFLVLYVDDDEAVYGLVVGLRRVKSC